MSSLRFETSYKEFIRVFEESTAQIQDLRFLWEVDRFCNAMTDVSSSDETVNTMLIQLALREDLSDKAIKRLEKS